MEIGTCTIPNSSINIEVMSIIKETDYSVTMGIFYCYKSGIVIQYERVTIPKDSLTHWIKLE